MSPAHRQTASPPKQRSVSNLSEGSSSFKSGSRNKDGFFKNRGGHSPTREEPAQTKASKGKKKKGNKRASSALTNDRNQSKMSANLPSTTTKPGRDASYNSKFSGSISPSMGEDEATVSKSLTDLANLPLPVPVQNKKSAGWDDDGFDDWNFEDVGKKEEPKKAGKRADPPKV